MRILGTIRDVTARKQVEAALAEGSERLRLALEPESQIGLVEAVRESPNWRLVYETKDALVFDRVAEIDAASSPGATLEP